MIIISPRSKKKFPQAKYKNHTSSFSHTLPHSASLEHYLFCSQQKLYSTPAMALCSSTTTSALPQFKPTPSYPSLSLSNPFFLQSNHTNTTHRFFTSHKLSTSSRQFSLLQPQSSRFSTVFAASASSAAVAHVEDKLPADILVTEKKEPNSRVSHSSLYYYSFFFPYVNVIIIEFREIPLLHLLL